MGARAALVACDVVTGFGDGLAATVEALFEGRTAVAPLRRFDGAPFGVDAAAVIDVPEAGASAEGPTRVVTRHGDLLLRLARAVHDAAGLGDLPRDALGFYVGLGVVDTAPEDVATAVAGARDAAGAFDLARFFAGSFRAIHPHWPLRMLNNVAVGQIAADLDLRGDNLVLASEADAGARAFAEALTAVRGRVASAAVVAGVAETVSPAALLRSRLRGTPAEVLGEGGGALVLEDAASAAARGRRPAGFLAGAGAAFGASESGPGPSADAVLRAARAALDDAGAGPDDVGVVFVEGTGAGEAEARRTLFGSRRGEVAVVAPAVGLGHLLAGSPAVAVALAAEVLARGRAPSTAHGRPRPVPRDALALVLASGSAGGAVVLAVAGPP